MKGILVGAFHEMVELCESAGIELVGIIDNNLTGTYLNYEIIGSDADASKLYDTYADIPLIITPDKPSIRFNIYKKYHDIGFTFCNVISPRAFVSSSASIGRGVVIQSGVNISAEVIVGDFVKINTLANIMHDSVIGTFSTIAPNAVILGHVNIGQHCYIGANSTILPYKTVKDGAVVGAGSVVTKDVAELTVVKGNPAKA